MLNHELTTHCNALLCRRKPPQLPPIELQCVHTPAPKLLVLQRLECPKLHSRVPTSCTHVFAEGLFIPNGRGFASKPHASCT